MDKACKKQAYSLRKKNPAHINMLQLHLWKQTELEVPYMRIYKVWVTAMEGTIDQTSFGVPSLMG